MKSAAEYVAEIIKYHTELQVYPDNTTLRNRLNYRLGRWVDLLDVTVLVANNEQIPWTADEMGMVTKPMSLKKDTGFDQVGDYQFFIGGEIGRWGGLIVERKGGKKGPEDLYSTLMNSEGRQRFYRELDRFHADPRFDSFYLLAECSMQDFFSYKPPFNGTAYNHHFKGASVESKRATIASLLVRGCTVLWCGSREQATKMYRDMVRQWIIKNYIKLIGPELK